MSQIVKNYFKKRFKAMNIYSEEEYEEALEDLEQLGNEKQEIEEQMEEIGKAIANYEEGLK